MSSTNLLGNVATFSKGLGLSKTNLRSDGKFPCIHYGELFTKYGAVINAPASRTDINLPVKSVTGDVLMPTSDVTPRGLAKASAILQDGIILGGDILVIRPDNTRVDSRYLAYAIRNDVNQILKLVRGSTVYHLYASDMKYFELYLPSKTQQERSSEVLQDIDRLVVMLERLITKKQAIKQGIMQQLLTGRMRLPGFTDPWSELLLGDHVRFVKTVALSRAQLDVKSPLKYLHYGDIHKRSSVLLDAAAEDMPRANTMLAASAGLLESGDLVFADASEDSAGVGKSVEIIKVPDAGVIPGLHTIAARFDKSVLADGFKAYLQFIPSFRNQLLRLVAGTKVLATNRSYISSVVLSLPNVTEQRAIAEVLLDADREIEALCRRLSKTRAVKEGVMQQLLTNRMPAEVSHE